MGVIFREKFKDYTERETIREIERNDEACLTKYAAKFRLNDEESKNF